MKRMIVNTSDPEECRIAIVQDGVLQELHVELADRESYLGNIYKGQVVNVEPSIGAAFVTFGGNKNGFLHASDVIPAFADPKVDLLDILEGRALAGPEDGPESMRAVLEDPDEDLADTDEADDEATSGEGGTEAGDAKAEKAEERLAVAAEPETSAEPNAATEDAPDEPDEPDEDGSQADSLPQPLETLDERVLDPTGEEAEIVEAPGELPADPKALDDSDDPDDDLDEAEGPDTASMAAASGEGTGAPPAKPESTARGDGSRRRRRRRRKPKAENGEAAGAAPETGESAGESSAEAAKPSRSGGRSRRRKAPASDAPDQADTQAGRPTELGVVGGATESVSDASPDASQPGAREQSRSKRGRRSRGGKKAAPRKASTSRAASRKSSRGRPGSGERRTRASADRRPSRPRLEIQSLLKKGQEVIVQITKEGIGAKGPTLTTYLSLPGRCLVLMPSLPKCGVSRKIRDDRERRRLKRIVRSLDETGAGGLGFIVRTAGVGKTDVELERDLEYLKRLWHAVVARTKVTRAPAPLYVESDLVLRTMRDLFTNDIDEVVIDAEPVYARVKDFVAQLMPSYAGNVKHHDGRAPIFLAYGIEQAVESLYRPDVDLSNGGSIVIEQTEALVAIDVNSGKFRPGTALEETAYKTNLESIPEIVRQLRLRDLGGLIIVDFIDMNEERHRRAIERKFRDALKGDRARINVGHISVFGMLEMTRQRVGPGLKRTVFQSCPQCHGSSLVRTAQSKALAVLREIRAIAGLRGYARLETYLSPEVSAFLENRKRKSLVEIEDSHDIEILVLPEPSYPRDIVHYRFLDANGRETKVNIPAGLGVRA